MTVCYFSGKCQLTFMHVRLLSREFQRKLNCHCVTNGSDIADTMTDGYGGSI